MKTQFLKPEKLSVFLKKPPVNLCSYKQSLTYVKY